MMRNEFDPNLDYQRSRLDHTVKKFESLKLPDLTGKRYLDLGCNSGAFCQLALDAGAAQVAGVDIDPRLINLARDAIPQAEFFVFRFEDMSLDSRQYDVITIASAIHYSQDFLTVSEKIFRHLAPDGLLVIEGGLFDPSHNTALNTPTPNWRQIGDHCRHLSMGFLRDVLFPTSAVSLIGPSMQQGGDNLTRFAVQVQRQSAQPSMEKRIALLDVEAFIRAIAISYSTVQSKYPVSGHMDALVEAAVLGIGNYDRLLGDTPGLMAIILSEVVYCIGDWASEVKILDPYGTAFATQLAGGLIAVGFSADVVRHYSLYTEVVYQ